MDKYIGTHTIVMLRQNVWAVDNEDGTYTVFEGEQEQFTLKATLTDLIMA